MKKNIKSAIRKNVEETFYAWCKQKGLDPNPDAFMLFDEAHPDWKLLDHAAAKRDGYHFHLRAQAAAIIRSWATVVPLKQNAGAMTPFPSGIRVRRETVMQKAYRLPSGTIPISDMNARNLQELMQQFKDAIGNKLTRMYIIAQKMESLEGVRKEVQESFVGMEQEAYNSVR